MNEAHIKTYLLLGTNQGDRLGNLAQARQSLAKEHVELLVESKVYESAPWGMANQSVFLNQVVECSTELSPRGLLTLCTEIELKMGRKRYEKWGARLIDIDILYYGSSVIREEGLVVPHPEIANRRFTLVPLSEITPDFTHPSLQLTNEELLDRCADPLSVNPYNQPD